RKPRWWSASSRPCADRSTSASRTGVADTPYCSAISLTVNSRPGWSRPASTSSRSASAICCRRVLRVTAALPLLPGMVRGAPSSRGACRARTWCPTGTTHYAFECGRNVRPRPVRRGSGHPPAPACCPAPEGSGGHVLVGHRQGGVQHRQALLEFRLGDGAGGHHVRAVHVHEGPHPALLGGGGERGHRGVGLTGRVVGDQRLADLPVADQFERPEHAG